MDDPPKPGPAVALEDVSVSLAGRVVIRRASLAIAPRQTLALIGPSGSGKSTIVRLIAGLVAPDAGRVLVESVEVSEASARALRRRIGYVIQDGGLFPHLTAKQNVTLVARLDGWSEERRRARVRELAELARLPERLLDRWPRQLSGGERQRVGLMRALMLDPSVLLLDEPLGALDPIVRARLQEDLLSIFSSLGKTVLVVTHDVPEAAYLADTIAVVRAGEIVQHGKIEELVETPAHPFVTELVEARRAVPRAAR